MAKYLVPMDFSKEAFLALDWTAKLAGQAPGSDIYLLTVGPLSQSREKEAAILAHIRREVADLQRGLSESINLYGFYRTGHVPEEVRDFCIGEKIDLVVMTTRGRFGQGRQLEGSTTEETVRLVQCPVLVLHLNQTTADFAHQRFNGILPIKENKPAF
jgi:nucleotide-binding universal stress UspA family protein